MNEFTYKVCVRCNTYNHSKFILETLKGFVSQITRFPYIILLLDDNSNDGTQETVRAFVRDEFELGNSNIAYEKETEYAHISYAQHKENRNCFILVHYLKYNHFQIKKMKLPYLTEWRSNVKYEALCEGDDYWTDPLKLQTQVDFLDSNPDFSFCCHRFDIYEQNNDRWLKEYAHNHYIDDSDIIITPELYSKVWITQPLTMMARMDAMEIISPNLKQYKYLRDVHLFYHLLKVGKGISLNRKMGVYRWHDGGIASSTSGEVRYQNAYDIYSELLAKTGDMIFRDAFIRNTTRLIRYKSASRESLRIIREAWKYSRGLREKINILMSFITPVFVIKWLTSRYRKHYLSNQTL